MREDMNEQPAAYSGGERSARARRSDGRAPAEGNGGSRQGSDRLARALGWFSIGLGVAELVAPRALGRMIGLGGTVPEPLRSRMPRRALRAIDGGDHAATLRLFGLREIGTGMGVLSRQRPANWLWARVAGDVLDLGFLGAAARQRGADPVRLATAALAVAGVTALDVLCGQRLTTRRAVSHRIEADGSLRVVHNLAINRPPQECYGWWRQLENLPTIMPYLERVEVLDDRTSHWVAVGPGGYRLEWQAEITEDQPGQLIAWRSGPGSDFEHEGQIRFQPGPSGNGTLVRAAMRYRSPGAAVVGTLARLFAMAPDQQLSADLRRFKQIIETGEVITTDGQPSGPARPTLLRAVSRALGAPAKEVA